MGAAAVELRRSEKITEVAARSGFKGYGPGKKQKVGRADVKEDEMLRRLKDAWRRYEIIVKDDDRILFDNNYGPVSDLLMDFNCSSEDVKRFSLALEELQGDEHFEAKAGLFLSVLINNGTDDEYVVHTEHLDKNNINLGYRNTKKIIVKGSVCPIGFRMEGGSILVEGNVDFFVGLKMKGGIIIVEGDTNKYLGEGMEGGTIIVKGNAGHTIGYEMKGGEIHLEGDHGNIDGSSIDIYGVEHGKIYNKGVLIVDK